MPKKDFFHQLDRLFDGLNALVSPLVSDREEQFKRLMTLLMGILSVPVLLGFAAYSYWVGRSALSAALLGISLFFSSGFVIARMYQKIDLFLKLCVGGISLLFLYLLAISGPNGHLALWLFILPMAVYVIMGRREGFFFMAVFITGIFIVYRLPDLIPSLTPLDKDFRVRFVLSFMMVSNLAYGFQSIRHRYQQMLFEQTAILEAEKEKLIAAKHEADEASRAKSDFLASMSHELRTPLNHIIGFTELVVGKNFGALNEIQREYLEDVLLSSRHLLSLINDMLDLAKIEAGKFELQLSDISINDLIKNSLMMVQENIMKKNIRIVLDIEKIVKKTRADSRKMKQILYNLLSNAVKYTSDHGEIQITANPVVRSVNGEEKHSVNICIKDNGQGIRTEDLVRIFDPFEQLENVGNKRNKGTGLGLALTRCLVELHGGRIWAESEGEGKGAAFFFTLPES